MIAEFLIMAAVAAAPVEREITAPGPQGSLAGTLTDAGKGTPVVLIIPGSGPTDRDGNNPLGVTAAPYRMLAEGLAKQGVSSIRTDKRGMFGSKAAIPDANKVTIADYAADAHAWVKSAQAATGVKCVWVLGHSEGSLVALTAGQKPEGICGVISVSGPGRKLGTVMRDQLKGNPANAPILQPALAALDSLEAGNPVDAATLPAPLQPLFNPAVQPFVMNLLAQDPPKLAAGLTVPYLIVQGDKDIQVSVEDAKLLAAGQPKAKLAVLPGVNHVLKPVLSDDRAANMAAYGDASLPIAPSVVDEIASFVKR
ncbi:alpha/beta hydrolase [Sphingomonas alba]|uniref:Lysophospholipase n=1 Tax=Sphingomonas alba TaxID=2908208 RepID=A0ABT0RMP7_9SPHN|nr:alpha/beta fold hydrolase [Sphingomonas alba]MCL6683922.1 lysophospholipase [Sphingomonas alba]